MTAESSYGILGDQHPLVDESADKHFENWRGRIAVAATAILALAGCSNNQEQSSPVATPSVSITGVPTTPEKTSISPAPPPSSHSPRPTVSPAETSCVFRGTMQLSKEPYGDAVPTSTFVGEKVLLGDHDTNGECYERFVLKLAGSHRAQPPTVRVEYVEPPVREEPSDQPVKIKGGAFLQATTGSWMYGFGGGKGDEHVTGSDVERIQEAVLTQNFEGVDTWTIGLDKKRDYKLSYVSDTKNCPDLCIVIDIEDKK